jgi:erythromycin esterase-like protein
MVVRQRSVTETTATPKMLSALRSESQPLRTAADLDPLMKHIGEARFVLLGDSGPTRVLLPPRGHRAIGVVYHPAYEHRGNYVPTVLPRRYDAFLYLDWTHALRPLHEVHALEDEEVPETYPSGM